jgi:hypothetical protein
MCRGPGLQRLPERVSLSKGLGLNRGDACLEGGTTVLPECCDVARVRVQATCIGAGFAQVLTLRAEDDGERKDRAYSQHMMAVACSALDSCDLRPNVRAKLPA